MSPTPDARPTPRTRRPRPAPDEGIDPIVPTPVAAPTAPPPPPTQLPARRGATATVQLNTRVSPELGSLVDAVAASRGWTKREVIEHALQLAYPKGAS